MKTKPKPGDAAVPAPPTGTHVYTNPAAPYDSFSVDDRTHAHLVELAAKPNGLMWSAGLWEFVVDWTDWLRSKIGYIGPPTIPLLPTPLPAKPDDNIA